MSEFRLVSFHHGEQRYLVDAMRVVSVLRGEALEPVDGVRAPFSHRIRHDDAWVPVIDFRSAAFDDRPRGLPVLLCRVGAGLVGLWVDSVDGVCTATPESLSPGARADRPFSLGTCETPEVSGLLFDVVAAVQPEVSLPRPP